MCFWFVEKRMFDYSLIKVLFVFWLVKYRFKVFKIFKIEIGVEIFVNKVDKKYSYDC